jgi:peptidoglycan biosynthesis protein MviN/MurJ (putative lipid II flippase)
MPSIRSRLRGHLGNPESDHRRIAVGFLWVSLFAVIGKLASAAKEMTIAWRYGVSETVDAYVFVTNLIGLPVSIWFGVLTVVLLPLVARVRGQNPSDLPKFRGELLGLTLVAGVSLGFLAYVGLPWLLNTGLSGFTGATLEKALSMAGPLSLLLPLGAIISLFSAWLMANGHHRNTLLEALPALTILGALFIPYGWVPEPLIWGTIAGLALQLLGSGWPLHRAGQIQSPVLGFKSPAWAGFWSSFGIMAAGQAFMGVTGIIDQLFAAHLGAGAISQLSYANRILSLIVSIGATAISRSTLPIFSELAGQGKLGEVRAMANQWARLMFLFGLLAMGIAWWFAPTVVELLFQRGAFTQSDTLAVAELMRLLVLQLPLYFSGIVFISLLSVQKKYATIQRIAVANLTVKVFSMILLTPVLGIQAIALSTTFMYFSSTLILCVSSRR